MSPNPPLQATNAVSSGVSIDPKVLRGLMALNNKDGLQYLATWFLMLGVTGYGLFLAQDSYWFYPALFAYATVLTVPAYSISHECAHSTFLKSKWMNKVVNWCVALIFFEDPVHRFYSHMRHHNYTWQSNIDTQMPFGIPLTFPRWFMEVSNLGQYWYDAKYMLLNALGIHDAFTRSYMPEPELPKLRWSARAFLAIYAVIGTSAWWFGYADILLMYIIIPRLIGGVSMQIFTIIQHAEMQEDQPDLRKSTRSFSSIWLVRFLYCYMNDHIEHHLYPKVPFHALKNLRIELGDQLPPPSKGLLATNLYVFKQAVKRSFGREKISC